MKVLLPVMKLFRELQVIDTFTSKHRLYYLPIYSFQHSQKHRAVARKKKGLRQYPWLNSPPSYSGSL